MKSEDIKHVHLSGIGYMALKDLSLTSPFLTMILDGGSPKDTPAVTLKTLNEVCLGFLDSHLK